MDDSSIVGCLLGCSRFVQLDGTVGSAGSGYFEFLHVFCCCWSRALSLPFSVSYTVKLHWSKVRDACTQVGTGVHRSDMCTSVAGLILMSLSLM